MKHSEPTSPAPTALLPWLAAAIARTLELAPEQIDVDADFDGFGLDSVQAVALSGELSDHLGRELPATLLYEHRSIRDLVDHLTHGGPA